MNIDKHVHFRNRFHWSENKMSAGALMWISVPLYITENETSSENKAIGTLTSQICMQNLDRWFKGLSLSTCSTGNAIYFVLSRICYLNASTA